MSDLECIAGDLSRENKKIKNKMIAMATKMKSTVKEAERAVISFN